MSRADAWMPFYVADYLRDTTHLSAEQHGAYVLLILACWTRGGTLPNDQRQLAQIARLSAHSWKKHAAIVLEFFRDDGAVLTHKRVAAEVEKSQRLSEVRREAGSRGGRPKSETPKPIAKANAPQNETPSPSPPPQKEESSRSSDLVPEEAYESDPVGDGFERFWKAYPQRKEKPVALKAFRAAVKSLKGSVSSRIEFLVAAAVVAAQNCDDPKFAPYPAKWLKNQGWNDEPTPRKFAGASAGRSSGPDVSPRVGNLLQGAVAAAHGHRNRAGGGG